MHAVYGEAIRTWLFFSALFALPLFGINLWLSERRIRKTEELLGGKLDRIDAKLDKLDRIDAKLDKLDRMSSTLDEIRDILRDRLGDGRDRP